MSKSDPDKVLDLYNQSVKDVFTLFPDISSVSVPNYQRTYCWDPQRAIEFLEPICTGQTLHIGTIVLYFDKETKNLQIIDGQQRLITLLLFVECSKEKIKEDSFFAKLGKFLKSRGDLRSKVQLVKNLNAIEEKFSTMNLEKFGTAGLSFYIFEDRKEAQSFYIRSNTRGAPLTPGQLLRAYHYSVIENDSSLGKFDLRYRVEAWRLGYVSQLSPSLDQNELTEEDYRKSLQGKLPKLDFIKSPGVSNCNYRATDFTVENFIANSDWNSAFCGFEGLMNTFQRVILGGENVHNTALAWPISDVDGEHFFEGLKRLQSSEACFSQRLDATESEKGVSSRENLLLNLLFIKPGLPFFETVDQLLRYYLEFQDVAKNVFAVKKDVNVQQENLSPWGSFIKETLKPFVSDRLFYENLKIHKEERSSSNLEHDAVLYGTLLSYFCISLLFELRFHITQRKKSDQLEVKKTLWASLWASFGGIKKDYRTVVRCSGVYHAGPIITLSPSLSLATQRMYRTILSKGSKLEELSQEIKKFIETEKTNKKVVIEQHPTIAFLLQDF